MNIHTFGQVIPYNSDNLPEQGFPTGPGTERPIGFPLDLMAKLYWNANRFKIAVTAIPLFDFSFETFLLGGGMTGTIVGSTIGLALVSMTLPIPIAFGGVTDNYHFINKKIRKKDSLDIDDEIDGPKILSSKTDMPREGTLVSAGPYHRLVTPRGACFINFSNILYFKRLFWPQILIFGWTPSLTGGITLTSALFVKDPLFSANLEKLPGVTAFKEIFSGSPSIAGTAVNLVGNTPTIGNINFLGGGIPLFGFGNINTYAVFGSISINEETSIN
jgi:hypothetical protein